MSRTFVEALREKYCDDGDENHDNLGNIKIVFTRPRTKSGSSEDGGAELGYLTNVVLCNTLINKAGIPPSGLTSLCPNVIDLDIGSNALSSWNEVLSIFQHLPALKFVNLSSNPLGESNQENAIMCTDQTFGINNLVLNNTKVTWDQATSLACLLPHLKELHLCQNDYNEITANTARLCESLPVLQCLRLNENAINRWDDISKLGSLPCLQTLILSDNPLLNIGSVTKTEEAQNPCTDGTEEGAEDEGDHQAMGGKMQESPHPEDCSKGTTENQVDISTRLQDVICQDTGRLSGASSSDNYSAISTQDVQKLNDKMQHHGDDSERSQESSSGKATSSSSFSTETMSTFQALCTLCVSNTKLASWSDLEALQGFPKLKSLKIRDAPLMQDASKEERRQLFVASLPKVSILNGGEVTSEEREKSERHYVRYFSEKHEPPRRYKELVQKHGELKSLSVIDLGRNFTEYAKLSFIYGGRCIHQEKMHATDSVQTIKKLCARLVKKNIMFLKIYYVSKNSLPGRQGASGDGSLHLDELFLDNLPISRYDMMDGDEIHIDVQQKCQRAIARIKPVMQTSIQLEQDQSGNSK